MPRLLLSLLTLTLLSFALACGSGGSSDMDAEECAAWAVEECDTLPSATFDVAEVLGADAEDEECVAAFCAELCLTACAGVVVNVAADGPLAACLCDDGDTGLFDPGGG